MRRKSILLLVGITSVVAVGTIYAEAFAHGRAGRWGGADGDLRLLARAAGLNRTQITSAFKSDANLKTDWSNLQSARTTLVSCLVTNGSCASQISSYASAQQALAQARMTVWSSLFQSAPDLKPAATMQKDLQQLRDQRKRVFEQDLGSANGATSDPTPDQGAGSDSSS
jgi:hypothetical protein